MEADTDRRTFLALGAAASAAGLASAPATAQGDELAVLDPIQTELVMNLVVTCSSPESMGPGKQAPDGMRERIWPIVGGRFEGPGIRGTVVPGGGDFPVMRADGVMVIDALYRLRTDDGTTIIIHNKGLGYSRTRYRLVPEFTVTAGRYDWLCKSIFLCTLVLDIPPAMRLAGPGQNDRLIQVHRVS